MNMTLRYLIICCLTLLTWQANAQQSPFPKGNPAPRANFTGSVWLHPLVADDTTFNCVVGSVTFEAGARSKWHSHAAGQLLLVTDGVCLTQERGKPIQTYKKGEVIKCAPNVEHWHGASPTMAMSHVSINPNTEKGIVKWLEPVSNQEYLGKN